MEYIETAMPSTRIKSKAQAKKMLKTPDINRMNSLAIIWYLLKKHKVGLLFSVCLVETLSLMGVLPILVGLVRK